MDNFSPFRRKKTRPTTTTSATTTTTLATTTTTLATTTTTLATPTAIDATTTATRHGKSLISNDLINIKGI